MQTNWCSYICLLLFLSCVPKYENSEKEFFYIQESSQVMTLPKSIRNVQGLFLEKGFTTIVLPEEFFEAGGEKMRDTLKAKKSADPGFLPSFALPAWSGYQSEHLALHPENAYSVEVFVSNPEEWWGKEISAGMPQEDFMALFSE